MDNSIHDKKILGETLKERRILLNLTKSRLKRLAIIEYKTIMSIEAGSSEYTIDSLIRYLSALKKVSEIKKLKLNKTTEKLIMINENPNVFEIKENKISF